ncbi:hypothetical protein QCA50_015582 [Cerrena zonata]|uniref:Secreted protein n=1 Tax=Cerrena zonata TaxID=2478898 RepID=A0AAW0FXN5_9APHY
MFRNTFLLPLVLLFLGIQYVLAAPIDATLLKRVNCDIASTRFGSSGGSPSSVDTRASLADCITSREPEPEPQPEPEVISIAEREAVEDVQEDEDDEDADTTVEKRVNCNIAATRFGSSGASPASVNDRRASLADCL